MKYILTQTNDVCENLAIEEWLYRSYTDEPMIVMLWQNSRAVVYGKHQNPWAEADIPFLEEQGIPAVRRISGGGTVFHDENNLNFTVIKNKVGSELFDLSEFTRPVHAALQHIGCTTSSSERGDILIEGMKVCGTAQAENSKRILYHGCILFDSNLGLLHQALHGGVETLESRATASVKSKVTNVSSHLKETVSMDTFKKLLLEAFKVHYGNLSELVLPEAAYPEIHKEVCEKYTQWEWNFGQTPRFSVMSCHRLAANRILTVVKGRVSSVEGNPEHPFLQRRFEPDRML